MVKMLKSALVLFALFVSGPVFAAAEYGTPEEAVALVERGIAHYNEVGADKAFADFNDKQGKFIDRDMYVFVGRISDCVILAHGGNKGLVGKSENDLMDINGIVIGAAILKVIATKPEGGWSEIYHWTNPVTKKLAAKRVYVKKVGEMFFGSGIYDPSELEKSQ